MDRPDAAPPGAAAPVLPCPPHRDPVLLPFGVVAVLVVTFFGLRIGTTAVQVVLFWSLMAVAHLWYAVMAWQVGRTPGDPPSTRRLWRLSGFGGAAFFLGDAVQLVAVARDPVAPASMAGTTPQAALILVGTVTILAGLLSAPLGVTSDRERSRLRLDLATVLSAAVTFGLYLLELPREPHAGRWLLDLVLGVLIEPGIFLVAVFAVVKVIIAGRPPFTRAAGTCCGLATGLTVFLQAVPLSDYTSPQTAPWLMGGNVVASGLLAAGARIQQRGKLADPHGTRRAARRPYSVLPYAAIAATYVLLVVALLTEGLTWHSWAVVGGAIVSTTLVVGRQLAAFRHIAELLAERDALAAKLGDLAYRDGLTGLANRALFMRRLTEALAPGADGELAVALVDLDDFKPVNDRYGHAAGDAMLRHVGRWLTDAVREGDTVARLGGDEFAVLLTDLPPGERDVLAQRLTAALHRQTSIGAATVLVRGSVGVALARPGTCTADELLHDADLAMYATKRRHKDAVLPAAGRPG